MSSALFNSSNYATKNNEKIVLLRPKQENGSRISKVYYSQEDNELSISYETNKIKLLDGVTFNSNNEAILKVLIDENSQDLYEFVQEVDELNIHTIWKNSKTWFEKKKQIDLEIIDDLFRSIIQVKKHQTILRFKINRENLYKLICTNQYGKIMVLKDLPVNAEIKLLLEIEGIKYTKNSFSTQYRIKKLKYYQARLNATEPTFFNSDNEENIFSADEFSDGENTDNNYLEYETANNNDIEQKNKPVQEIEEYEGEQNIEELNCEEENLEDNNDVEEQENEKEVNEEQDNFEKELAEDNERDNLLEENVDVKVKNDNEEINDLDKVEDFKLLSQTLESLLEGENSNISDMYTYENSLNATLSDNEDKSSKNTESSKKKKMKKMRMKFFNKVRTYKYNLE
jgi:hypothetical protein